MEGRQRLGASWRELSLFLQSFYADLRLLDGRAVQGNRIDYFMDAESHPATYVFWQGIPSEPAFARVIGALYLDLWRLPSTDGLAFLGPQDWMSRASDTTEVPAELASFPKPRPPGLIFGGARQPARVIPFARPGA